MDPLKELLNRAADACEPQSCFCGEVLMPGEVHDNCEAAAREEDAAYAEVERSEGH